MNKTQEQILAFLIANPEEQLTIRGIAKRMGKSYPLVYNNLLNLEKEGIVKMQDIPPGKIVKIDEFAPTEILVDIELKRKNEFLKKYSWIKLMLDDISSSTEIVFFILIVFGSYAKGKETAKSDLDLLVIIPTKEDIKKMEKSFYNAYTKIKKSFNFIDINDFIEMIKNSNGLNIGNEAKKHHIILYGSENYYNLIKKATK